MKLRPFLRYYNIDKIADNLKIKMNKLQQHKILEEDSLSKEEINKLIDGAEELYDKALIESYIVTGGRNKEIARLKIKDIIEEINYIEFEINKRRRNTNKTKTRNIYIVADPNNAVAIYPKNLIIFLHNHKYKNNPDAYVFYSTSVKSENKGKHIAPGTVWKRIKKFGKNSKLNKNIYPHLIRHTSASFDGLVLPIPMFCEKYGWDKDSPEVERYCKPSKQMKIDFLLKKAGVNPEEVNRCPRCNEKNSINADICQKCNTILGKELIVNLEKKLSDKDNAITKLSQYRKENIDLKNEFTTLKIQLVETLNIYSEVVKKQLFLSTYIYKYPDEYLKMIKIEKDKDIPRKEKLKILTKLDNKYKKYLSKSGLKTNIKSLDDIKELKIILNKSIYEFI